MNWTTVSQQCVVSDFLYYEAGGQIDIESEYPKSDETSCSTINKGRIFIFKCLILAVCKQIAARGNCRALNKMNAGIIPVRQGTVVKVVVPLGADATN